jgi:hypothetical protein
MAMEVAGGVGWAIFCLFLVKITGSFSVVGVMHSRNKSFFTQVLAGQSQFLKG